MKTIAIDVITDLVIDHRRNFSRSGEPHREETVRDLAECMRREGQRTPIEVYPLHWPDGEEPRDDQEAREAGFARRASKKKPRGYGIVAGYRRVEAALLLLESKDLGAWGGALEAFVFDAHVLTDEEIQDLNLSENTKRSSLTPMDEALIIHHLSSPTKEGGRGEELAHIVSKLCLRGGIPRARQLRKLVRLIPEAQALVRAHFWDPDVGLPLRAALPLAKKSAEDQREVLASARDGAGRVTPKAVRAVLTPRQGAQGQPPGRSGASLSRVRDRLDKLVDQPATLAMTEVSPREVDLLRGFLHILQEKEGDPPGVPQSLAKILRASLQP